MNATRCVAALAIITICGLTAGSAQLASMSQDNADRAARHQSIDWQMLAPHLPDPSTGSPAALATAADVMRARRLPEDALDYYGYAIQRGGDQATLTNRIGVTWLELHQPALAKASFRSVVRLTPKDSQAWNNLGASEYSLGEYRAAINDYLRAIKLSKKTAVFHSNLGTAYFEVKDFESARQQFTTAIKLDSNVFQGDGMSGIEAHVMSPSDRGRFCFEMAKLAARQNDDHSALLWLARASEVGFDIRGEMNGDKDFKAYYKDARIAMIVRNAKAMRDGQIAETGIIPPLPPPTPLP